MHVVIAFLGRPAEQRAIVVLRAERHARAGVGLEIGEVDQVLGLGVSLGHVVLLDILGPAAPVERNGRCFILIRPNLPAVHTYYVRKLFVENVIVLVGKIRQTVADGDVRLLDADGVQAARAGRQSFAARCSCSPASAFQIVSVLC